MEKKYLLAYKLLSTAAAVLVMIIFLLMIEEDVISPQWKQYQSEYLSMTKVKGMELNFPKFSTIRQIEIQSIGHVDRCITCHLNMGQSGYASLELPYASHPGTILEEHELPVYSCTFCHNGNGRSLKRHQTCGEKNSRDRKPLESNCVICHLAVFDTTQQYPMIPEIIEGLELFNSSGCLGCHKLRSLGGPFGPDLSAEGDKIYQGYDFRFIREEKSIINWQREHFKTPADIVPKSIMPNFNFNTEQTDALISLVLGFSRKQRPLQYYTLGVIKELKHQRSALDASSAYKIICSACHGADGQGLDYKKNIFGVPSLANPDFQAIASIDMISFIMTEGRGFRYMPSWRKKHSGLKQSELSALTSYIREWRKKPASYVQVSAANYSLAEGENLYLQYCATCHGKERRGGIGTSLDKNAITDLATDKFLYNTLVNGRSNTAMPSWSRFDAYALKSLIRFLKPSSKDPVDRTLKINSAINIEHGKTLFHYQCSRCHGANGMGAIGPAILNPDFLAAADDYFILETIRRGRNHTPMFGAKQSFNDLVDLITFMRSMQDTIPAYIESAPSLGNPEKGEDLFLTYCSECHGKTGEGSAAPALNNQEFLNAATNGYLLATITLGRSSTPMPAWGMKDNNRRMIPPRERQHVVSFIRNWQKMRIRRDTTDPIFDLLANEN